MQKFCKVHIKFQITKMPLNVSQESQEKFMICMAG